MMLLQRLLQIDAEELQACLTSMVTVTKGEYVKRLYNKHQAEGSYRFWDVIKSRDNVKLTLVMLEPDIS